MLFVAIFAPIMQLVILGYVASTDIKHISTVIMDLDKTAYSRTYLQSFRNSGYFDFNYYVDSIDDVKNLIDNGKAQLGLNIPVGFGRKISGNKTAAAQAIIDGSNASTATVIQGYISQINFNNSNIFLEQRLERSGFSANTLQLFNLETRIWYNPELKSINFMVPAIFALVLLLESMILTTSSIVKEKEKGTMEMLAVTPLKPYELILGKLVPFAIVAFLDIALVFLVATIWFGIPMKGSVLLLFVLGGIFLATGLGLGVFISTISRTQREALMTSNFVMMPSFILSGFIFPISNMPQIIQAITLFIPLRYFLSILRGLFLKGIGLKYLWPDIWPLIIFGVAMLGLSILMFRKKIG